MPTHPLVDVGRFQWEAFKTFHSTGLRVCLRLPSFTLKMATLVEGNYSPLQLVEEERSIRHLEGLNRSAPFLITRLLQRPHTHTGPFAAIFQRHIGTPEQNACSTISNSNGTTQHVHHLVSVEKKTDTPVVIARSLVGKLLGLFT